MVSEKDNRYICEGCGLEYEDKIWAEKCEAWCKKTQSCNLEITKHSKRILKRQKEVIRNEK